VKEGKNEKTAPPLRVKEGKGESNIALTTA